MRQRRSKHRAEKDDAVVVWRELIHQRKKRDDRIQAALDAIGGWPRIQQRAIGDERVMREFCDAYLRHD